MKKSILLIYTGGTIGMIKNPKKKSLVPFNFDKVLEELPELKNNEVKLSNISIKQPIDSSNMNIQIWIELAQIIKENYKNIMVSLCSMVLTQWLLLHLQ